ncbi:MAG: hypothetical protein QXS19_07665 [Candidatus Methanomethylicia archaeon]
MYKELEEVIRDLEKCILEVRDVQLKDQLKLLRQDLAIVIELLKSGTGFFVDCVSAYTKFSVLRTSISVSWTDDMTFKELREKFKQQTLEKLYLIMIDAVEAIRNAARILESSRS